MSARNIRTSKVIRSVWNVIAEDKDGKQYNIEVQRDIKGADPRRFRFYNAMMDVEMLGAGEDYSELKDSYTIVITEDDIFKEGEALYIFDRVNIKNGKPLGDGSHIIYANGSYDGDDPLGWLMRDFREPDPTKMHYKVLAERVNYLKNDIKGEKEMCKIVEELVEEGRQEGIQKGRQEGRLEGIKFLIAAYRKLGMTQDQIIKQIASEYEIPQSEVAKHVYAE